MDPEPPVSREVAAQDEGGRGALACGAIIALSLPHHGEAEAGIERPSRGIPRIDLQEEASRTGLGKASEMGREEPMPEPAPAMRGRHGERQDLGLVDGQSGEDDRDEVIVRAIDHAMREGPGGIQEPLEIRRVPGGIEARRVDARAVGASIGRDRGDPKSLGHRARLRQGLRQAHVVATHRKANVAKAPSAVRTAWSPPHFSIKARLVGPASSVAVRISRLLVGMIATSV